MNGTEPMGEILTLLGAKADALYRFVMLYHDFAMEKRDYGTGEEVNMAEAHTLMKIAENPGITVSEIALDANRTKSSISQTVKKLEQMGFVFREYSIEDGRVAKLYSTDKGDTFNEAHRMYDSFEVSSTFEDLLKHCTMTDIDAFFKVIYAYLQMFADDTKR